MKSYLQSNPLSIPLDNGLPTIYNGVPLNINTSETPYLILNFSTNINTAFTIAALTSPTINSTDYSNNLFYLSGTSNNPYIEPPSIGNAFGAYHYTSPNKTTTMIINLNQVLQNSKNRTVNYIIIQLYPVSDNGTGIQGLTVNEWPGYQNLTISYLATGNFFSSLEPAGTYITNLNESIGGLYNESHLHFSMENPTLYHLIITSNKSMSPMVIAFHQNFNTHWVIEELKGVRSWKQIILDDSINGYIIVPVNGTKNISFTLEFNLQRVFELVIYSSLAINLIPTVLMALPTFKRVINKHKHKS